MLDSYDYIDSSKFTGKIILTSFPGLNDEGKFDEKILISQLEVFSNNQCSSITSFVEDKEFDVLCDKKLFVEKIYHHNLKWYHMPIADLGAPNQDFKYKWETTKVLLKNELLDTVFPNINIKGDIEEHKTLLSIDKAKKILGFKPEYSWRNIV